MNLNVFEKMTKMRIYVKQKKKEINVTPAPLEQMLQTKIFKFFNMWESIN